MSARTRLISLVVAVVAAAGIPVAVHAATTPPAVTPEASGISAAALTRDGADTYGIRQSGGVLSVHAPTTNIGGNTRVIFWQQTANPSADTEACATWLNESSDHDQQGVALRISGAGGVTRAITVTKNMFGPNYIFNVHVWDTGARPFAFTQIASFDLKSTFAPHGALLPLPWSMCAQTLGDTLSFMAWPNSQKPPAWNDARYGGSVTLPSSWDYAGASGWYLGHLLPGESAAYSNLSTAPATLEPTVDAVLGSGGSHSAP